MIDLCSNSVIEVLTGFAPNYTTFLVLRALFGIGMGAEWGVGASLVMERSRPFIGASCRVCCKQGYALASARRLCYRSLSRSSAGGPLFFIGGLPALLALFVRARVKESEVWRETRHETWSGLGRAIRAISRCSDITVLMWMMNMVMSPPLDMNPAFAETDTCHCAARRTPRIIHISTVM